MTIVIRFSPPPKAESTVRFILTYQACDDTSCFPPVTKQLEMDVPSVH